MSDPDVFKTAYLRVKRGRKLLLNLEKLCDHVCEEYAEKLESFYPPSLPDAADVIDLMDSTHPQPNIPPTVAIRVGEIVYSFRAALDYRVVAGGKAECLPDDH